MNVIYAARRQQEHAMKFHDTRRSAPAPLSRVGRYVVAALGDDEPAGLPTRRAVVLRCRIHVDETKRDGLSGRLLPRLAGCMIEHGGCEPLLHQGGNGGELRRDILEILRRSLAGAE